VLPPRVQTLQTLSLGGGAVWGLSIAAFPYIELRWWGCLGVVDSCVPIYCAAHRRSHASQGWRGRWWRHRDERYAADDRAASGGARARGRGTAGASAAVPHGQRLAPHRSEASEQTPKLVHSRNVMPVAGRADGPLVGTHDHHRTIIHSSRHSIHELGRAFELRVVCA
jgi:hypothetical protein